MMILLIILGIVALAGIWAVSSYNGLVHLKAYVDEAWSGIDVQLKRRYDLIPNLVSVVKGYATHEKSIMEEIARSRAAALNAKGIAQKGIAEAQLTRSLRTLFALSENYPDLKANAQFLSLQKELSALEHELQLSRRYYNGAARNYNTAVIQFPTKIISSITGFHPVSYFEIVVPEERDVPKIQF